MSDEPVPTAIVRSGAPAVSSDPTAPPPPGAIVIPTYTLYSRTQIGVTTFLCGPVAGGWMLFQNWRRVREPGKAWAAFLATIVITGTLFAIGFAIPNIPALPLPILGLAAVLGLASQQRRALDLHLQHGGRTASGWRAAGVGALSLVIVLVLLFGGAIGYLFATQAPQIDLGHDHTVRYLAGGTEQEARALGKELDTMGILSPDHPASFGVRRDGSHHVVEFVMQDDYLDKESVQRTFRTFASDLSAHVFHGEPVDIWLEDDTYEPRHKLVWEPDAGSNADP